MRKDGPQHLKGIRAQTRALREPQRAQVGEPGEMKRRLVRYLVALAYVQKL